MCSTITSRRHAATLREGCAEISAAAPATRTSSTRSATPPPTRRRLPMSEATPFVGRAMKRVEDPRLVQGLGTYTDDLNLAGLLHACILRGPHAHARIRRIDTSAAKAIPGVVAVLTGTDVNESCGAVPCAAAIPDLKAPRHTALAGDRVYFDGHAVAVAVTTDPYIARDAVDAIDVDYEPLAVVVDPEAAMKAGSPLTHPDL